MALSHISAYVAEQADGIYPGYGSKSQLIGEHFISRCKLDTSSQSISTSYQLFHTVTTISLVILFISVCIAHKEWSLCHY